jgi:hypothetical protein
MTESKPYRLRTPDSRDGFPAPQDVINVEDYNEGYAKHVYRVGSGTGFSTYFDFVAASNEQDALDILVDAYESARGEGKPTEDLPWIGILQVAEEDRETYEAERGEDTTYLGNYGTPYDLTDLRVLEVIDYPRTPTRDED